MHVDLCFSFVVNFFVKFLQQFKGTPDSGSNNSSALVLNTFCENSLLDFSDK
jgi:hypothetical protein